MAAVAAGDLRFAALKLALIIVLLSHTIMIWIDYK